WSGILRIATQTMLFIANCFACILHFDKTQMTGELMRGFADAVAAKGAGYVDCFGFVDRTMHAICHPTRDQHISYNGWKRFHAVKFQGATSPDGIIWHLSGPYGGQWHDLRIFCNSPLYDILEQFAFGPNNEPLIIYGDPAYVQSLHVQVLHKGSNLTPRQAALNASMSQVRIASEWGYGKVTSLKGFINYTHHMQLGRTPVGTIDKVAIFLTNCHTCFYGGVTSSYFNIQPPLPEDYLCL
ncbi:hypothetical protein M427DRAFT_99243, partial [Gonapodya prolifera JEL478]